MHKRVVLIHALIAAMQAAEQAFRHHWPAVQCVNLLDDSLAPDRLRDGGLTPAMFRRIAALIDYAIATGGDGVLFTCSAFGAAIEAAAATVRVPVLKPNEAMFEEAIARGTHVGMLVTFPAAADGMQQEFDAMAKAAKRDARLEVLCVPEAMTALRAGDNATHDRLLAEAARGLAHCDVILLGQFSTARAEPAVAAVVARPVLTGPASAVRKLKARVETA